MAAPSAHPDDREALSHNRRLSPRRLLVFMAIFATAGAAVVALILAAGASAIFEPESGTLSAGARQISRTDATGGQAVQLSAPTPTPTATATPTPGGGSRTCPGGKPAASCTGALAGTNLTIVTGNQTYSQDNQVISGLDIRGYVQITGKNVTIRNSIIRGGSRTCTTGGSQNNSVLWIRHDTGATATIEDVEIAPSSPTACMDGIWAINTTLTRVNVHGAVDGIKAFDNVVIQDSYIHDLAYFSSDPNQGGGETHNDAVQTYEGNQNITIRRNHLAMRVSDNATYQLTQDGGKKATNIRIENNWLYGGGCTLNLAHKGGPTPMTGLYLLNNRFGRNTGYANCPVLISTQTVLSQNSGNVWDDTGTAIPAPQRHD